MHLHTKKYSSDSELDLLNGIKWAKKIGLDGLCITDHDSMGYKEKAQIIAREMEFPLFVGVEVFSDIGDIVVFGLENAPKAGINILDLLDEVELVKGAAIAAHPFRKFSGLQRAIKNNIYDLKDRLHGLEVFNGNTKCEDNYTASLAGIELPLACGGGSDAHRVEEIGKYANYFPKNISNTSELIKEIRRGNFCLAVREQNDYMVLNSKHKILQFAKSNLYDIINSAAG